jgi:hypothetical protein
MRQKRLRAMVYILLRHYVKKKPYENKKKESEKITYFSGRDRNFGG